MMKSRVGILHLHTLPKSSFTFNIFNIRNLKMKVDFHFDTSKMHHTLYIINSLLPLSWVQFMDHGKVTDMVAAVVNTFYRTKIPSYGFLGWSIYQIILFFLLAAYFAIVRWTVWGKGVLFFFKSSQLSTVNSLLSYQPHPLPQHDRDMANHNNSM